MKAKVIISNGKTEIILEPENGFEREVIERTIDEEYKLVKTSIESTCSYSEHKNHKIVIEIEKV